MALPAEGLAATEPTWQARSCYRLGGRVVGPMLGRYLGESSPAPIDDRLATTGRFVAAISRAQRLRPFARRLTITRRRIGGALVETVRAAGCTAPLTEGGVLYFHGGGFFLGNLDSHLHVIATLARRTGLPVTHVDYRQHPEVRVDGSVADCLDVYRWLLEQGADSAKVVFAGDSAGGFLAFATALAAAEHGLPAPGGVIGISPLLDMQCDGRLAHENAERDPVIKAAALPAILGCTHPVDGSDPSPVNGDFAGFPPALILVGESESLRYDAERVHDAITAAGGSGTLTVWPGQLHAFPAVFPFLPESKAAYDRMIAFIAECRSGALRT